jgi:hypothetical protein
VTARMLTRCDGIPLPCGSSIRAGAGGARMRSPSCLVRTRFASCVRSPACLATTSRNGCLARLGRSSPTRFGPTIARSGRGLRRRSKSGPTRDWRGSGSSLQSARWLRTPARVRVAATSAMTSWALGISPPRRSGKKLLTLRRRRHTSALGASDRVLVAIGRSATRVGASFRGNPITSRRAPRTSKRSSGRPWPHARVWAIGGARRHRRFPRKRALAFTRTQQRGVASLTAAWRRPAPCSARAGVCSPPCGQV